MLNVGLQRRINQKVSFCTIISLLNSHDNKWIQTGYEEGCNRCATTKTDTVYTHI